MIKLTSALFHTLMLKLYAKVLCFYNIQCLYPDDGLCYTENQGTNGKVAATSWFYEGVEKENNGGLGGIKI